MPPACDNPLVVFNRVRVDFLVAGNARVTWEISSHFNAPEPWTFQLQEAQSDLDQANWIDVGTPVTNTCFTLDPVSRAVYGKELNIFYRVKLTDANNVTYVSAPAVVFGNLDMRSWNYAQEIVRKENLRLSMLGVGIEGWLLKIKMSGTPCPQCLDQFTGEVTNSNCPTCFGSRWVGGYYAPQPVVFADVTAEETYHQRATEEGMGMINPQIVRGMFIAEPYLATMDVWVNHSSDVRYHVHNVKPRTHIRGVPVLVIADLRPIPFDNVVYKIPIPRTFDPCPQQTGC